jgi:hypothetical protein
MGPFPASKRALQSCPALFPMAGNALVREGDRNLVVILWKSQYLFRKISPADEADSLWPVPDGADSFLLLNCKANFSSQTGAYGYSSQSPTPET